MSVLYVAIPVAFAISILSVVAFARVVSSGQLDDLETPPRRMLFDDDHHTGSPGNTDSE